MCGLAGLSIGCGLAPTCPKSLLRHPRAVAQLSRPVEPLASWPDRASVRTRPHPRYDADVGGPLFPRALVPVVDHPLVAERGEAVQRSLLAHHLFRYMQFTATLEHLVVNRTVLALAHDSIGFDLPEGMRLDAYRIYCDEGYHACVAAELAHAIARAESLRCDWHDTPYFLERLGAILDEVDPTLRGLVEILFVICSETLISGTLSDAASAPDTAPAVRQALEDHAHDERRHHAYFAEILRAMWPQLTPSVRQRAGTVVPALIDAFLRPDMDGARRELCDHGLSRDDAECVIAESYPENVVRSDRRHVARHTVRYFQEVAALDDAATLAAFVEADLVPAPSQASPSLA
jgi:hypothetical protein